MRFYLKGACRILAGAEVTHSPLAHLLLRAVAPGLWITSAGTPISGELKKPSLLKYSWEKSQK